jgi:hypothetical protein
VAFFTSLADSKAESAIGTTWSSSLSGASHAT